MSEPNPYQSPGPHVAIKVTGIVPVRVSGLLTATDAIKALGAVGKWRTWPYYALAITLVLIAVALMIRQLPSVSIVSISVFLVGAVFFAIRPLILRIRFIRSWNARPEYQQPITWVFSDEGIFVESTMSKHQQAWEAYQYAKISTNEIVLAHHGNAMFNFVPVRFFASEQELAAVRQMIAAKLPLR